MEIPENIAQQLDLSDKEITVYQLLLAKNKVNAHYLIQESGLKRSTVYSVLDSLVSKGLVEMLQDQAILHYRARHPYRMKELAETKVREIEMAERQLEGILPTLIHQYESAQKRPGVKFYEGKEGIKKVLQDSLTAKEEILTYADVQSIMKYIPDINEDYAKKRDKLNIKKRGIMPDTPFIRELLGKYHTETTFTKLVPLPPSQFKTVMQIYDGKVSYITMSDDFLIGVIISDVFIYQMHKEYFEYLWNITPDVQSQSQTPNMSSPDNQSNESKENPQKEDQH